MTGTIQTERLREEVARTKDLHGRKYSSLKNNFYLLKSALRYYSVKKGMSITSTRVSEDFPLAVTVAGSCLSVLEELSVIKPRSASESSSRYLPEGVDLERLEAIEQILVDNREIEPFSGRTR